MAAGNFEPYWTAILKVANNTLNLGTGDFSAVLLADTYTISLAHDTYADISAHVISGGDYPGPVALASLSVARSNQYVSWDAAKIVFTASGNVGPAKYCAIVAAAPGGIGAGSHLVSVCDLNAGDSAIQSFNTEFSVEPGANGIFRLAGVASYGA